jgi:ABC-2 type transport system ATP-binding protein
MLRTEQLTRRYGPLVALDALDLDVPAGQIVALLGPNGAGKTTLLRLLTGVLPPTAGRALVHHHDVVADPDAARAALGYLPEHNPLYPEMRAEELLHFTGAMHGMSRPDRRRRIDTLTDQLDLAPVRRRLIGQLSKGNRQRVGLAAALIHEPPVLILDEPTTGLDPAQVPALRQLLRDLAGRHTLLLSTHLLPEAQQTADRLLILAQGQLVADGSPTELRDQAATAPDTRPTVRVEVAGNPDAIRQALTDIPGLKNGTGTFFADSSGGAKKVSGTFSSGSASAGGDTSGGYHVLRFDLDPRGPDPRPTIAARLARLPDVRLRQLTTDTPSLEALFLRLVTEQHQAAEPAATFRGE